uniref:Uncharacterized protein n=1 Tax=Anguilla anguilla TaxID=7936 RepID=A0A0E9WD33_ANGAN
MAAEVQNLWHTSPSVCDASTWNISIPHCENENSTLPFRCSSFQTCTVYALILCSIQAQ